MKCHVRFEIFIAMTMKCHVRLEIFIAMTEVSRES
jgi:hypothetical protein